MMSQGEEGWGTGWGWAVPSASLDGLLRGDGAQEMGVV